MFLEHPLAVRQEIDGLVMSSNGACDKRPEGVGSGAAEEYNSRDGKPDGDAPDSMPTLLLAEGFRFYFFSLENGEPPHVHIRKRLRQSEVVAQPSLALEVARFWPGRPEAP